MAASEESNVIPQPSNEVIRKKLEAELRATEEIARIRQSVIEKRLAVELATLGEEPPGGLTLLPQQSKPSPQTIPNLAPVVERRARSTRRPAPLPEVLIQEATSSAFAGVRCQKSPFSIMSRSRSPTSRRCDIPDIFKPISDPPDDEDEEEEELTGEQPRKRPSFFKVVMKKFKRRLRSEERETE